MVQIEMHSCHGEPTGVKPTGAAFPHVPPLEQPADEVMSLLTKEMENMVIEGKLMKEADAGPLQTTVKMAVERRKRKDEEQRAIHADGEPLWISASSARVSSTLTRRTAVTRPLGSPSPSWAGRNPDGYIRARSRSC